MTDEQLEKQNYQAKVGWYAAAALQGLASNNDYIARLKSTWSGYEKEEIPVTPIVLDAIKIGQDMVKRIDKLEMPKE